MAGDDRSLKVGARSMVAVAAVVAASLILASPAGAAVKKGGGNAWGVGGGGTFLGSPLVVGPVPHVVIPATAGPASTTAPAASYEAGSGFIEAGAMSAHVDVTSGAGGSTNTTSDLATIDIGPLTLSGVHSECTATDSGYTDSWVIASGELNGDPIDVSTDGPQTLPFPGGTIFLTLGESVDNSVLPKTSTGHINAARVRVVIPVGPTDLTVTVGHSRCFTTNN